MMNHLPPADPREQAVEDVYHLPRPLLTDPIHVQAMRGDMDHDGCAACSEPMRLHYDTSGIFWIGCDGALRRRSLGLVGIGDEFILGDQHPAVSEAVRSYLLTSCGALTYLFAETRRDEQVQIARTLAVLAVRAYLKESGR